MQERLLQVWSQQRQAQNLRHPRLGDVGEAGEGAGVGNCSRPQDLLAADGQSHELGDPRHSASGHWRDRRGQDGLSAYAQGPAKAALPAADIVTLESTPLLDPIYLGIDRKIKSEIPKYPDDFLPWQNMNIGEVELLEGAMSGGNSFLSLILGKLDAAGPALCFRNYWHEIDDVSLNKPNKYLDEIFERVTSTSTEWVRARSSPAMLAEDTPAPPSSPLPES